MLVGIVRWLERNLLRIRDRTKEKAAEGATSYGGDFSPPEANRNDNRGRKEQLLSQAGSGPARR